MATKTSATCRQAALESELKDLVELSREREALRIDSEPDPVDQIQLMEDREVLVRQLSAQTDVRRDVEAALGKISAGKYGVCEHCGQPIPTERLAALPWARLCVLCQSNAE